MAISIQNVLKSASRYAATHPRVLGEMARHAIQRRIAVPLDSVRWVVTQLPAGKSSPQDVTITARPPALGLGATVDVMGTLVRIDAAIRIDYIHATAEDLQVTLRVNDLRASVLNNLDGNLAKLLASGVLNLSKPAQVLGMVGKMPPMIVDAKDNTFVIDLMKVDSIANNPKLRKALSALTPIVSVSEVRTDGDTLLIGLKPRPSGIKETFSALRG